MVSTVDAMFLCVRLLCDPCAGLPNVSCYSIVMPSEELKGNEEAKKNTTPQQIASKLNINQFIRFAVPKGLPK